MRTLTASLLLLLAACASPAAEADDEHETEVAATAVPQLVRDAVAKAWPGATVSEWSRESEDGVTCYEAELTVSGRHLDVLVRGDDGRILEEEEAIEASALPAAVTSALAAAPFTGMKIAKAERIVKDGKRDEPLYEVHLKDSGHAREVVFDARGRIVEQEDKSGSDDED
jgi:uncharacterized membrane protein YkoI